MTERKQIIVLDGREQLDVCASEEETSSGPMINVEIKEFRSLDNKTIMTYLF